MWLQKEASQWSWVQTPHKALDPPLTNKVESNNKVFNLVKMVKKIKDIQN